MTTSIAKPHEAYMQTDDDEEFTGLEPSYFKKFRRKTDLISYLVTRCKLKLNLRFVLFNLRYNYHLRVVLCGSQDVLTSSREHFASVSEVDIFAREEGPSSNGGAEHVHSEVA